MSDTADRDITNFTGKLLIAMPGMGDPRFEKSVIFLCAHGDEGSMGLIINKPSDEIGFDTLLDQLDIDYDITLPQPPVHFGGPMEGGRGFVLHSRDYGDTESSLRVGRRFAMTATLDILKDMARGSGPERALVALGYAGWAPAQLEREIAGNGWLVVDAAPDLVFSGDDDGKWLAAIGALGIDPILLSAAGGRA